MKTVEEYLKENPTASLFEYKEYKDNSIRMEEEILAEKTRKKLEWYKEKEGKWFFVKNNNNSFQIGKLVTKTDVTSSRKGDLQYRIYTDKSTFGIVKDTNGIISKWHVNNPYDLVEDAYWLSVEISEEHAETLIKIQSEAQNKIEEYLNFIKTTYNIK